MKFKVEKGKAQDAATLAQFQLDMALESEGTVLDLNIISKGVANGLADEAKGTYFLLKTEEGKVVGSLLLTKEWSDWKNNWYWWIQSVYVKPEYRRMGAFGTLYEYVRSLARKEGALSLRLYVDKENIKAQKCYQKQGMDECHYLMYEEDL